MERALREIREEAQDIYDGLSGEKGEDVEALRKAAKHLIQLLSRHELTKEMGKKRDLALSVMEFAEWQSAGYIEDGETRRMISRTLWDRVSENVRDVLEQTPPTPSFS